MALIEAQMQAVKQNLEEAMGGSKSAQAYFKTLRDGGHSFQIEMLDYAIELVSQKGLSQDAPLAGVNLIGVQIGSARKTLARLKVNPQEFDASNFWGSLERNAMAGDPIAKEFLKAREIIQKEMADDSNASESSAGPKLPDWLSGSEAKTSPATPQAQAASRPPIQPSGPLQTPVSAFTRDAQLNQITPPAASQWDPSRQNPLTKPEEFGTWPGQQASAPTNGHTAGPAAQPALDGYAATLALRDEIKVMRDEILKARDQILEALFKKPEKPTAPEVVA